MPIDFQTVAAGAVLALVVLPALARAQDSAMLVAVAMAFGAPFLVLAILLD